MHKSKTNPQNQKRNEEKSFKLLKKSLQSCKVAEKITPKPQSCMRKQEKVKREMKKKVVKLVKKSQLTSNSKRMQNAFPKLEEKLQTESLQKVE